MKTRNDFVSNSSSSSYIVITNTGKYVNPFINTFEIIELPMKYDGCREFGWQTEKYYDICSKLNWASIVILDKIDLESGETSSEYLTSEISKPWFRAEAMENMLKKVCKEKFGIDVELRKDEYRDHSWEVGYIDHQSSIRESPENGRMFMTKEMLYDFLANDNSYIDNSNDNGGRDDEWDDELECIPPPPNDYEI